MIYRFRVSRKPASHRERKKPLRLCGKSTLRRKETEPIVWDSIFRRNTLTGAPKKAARKTKKQKQRRNRPSFSGSRPQRVLCAFAQTCKDYGRRLGRACSRLWSHKRKKPRRGFRTVPILCGALCAALLVSFASAGTLGASFLLPYRRPYATVTVPNLVNQRVSELSSAHDLSRFHLIVRYEENPNVPPDTVISQSPAAGVVRRIYESNEGCTLVLTVSSAPSPIPLQDLRGMSERDASLLLRNEGLNVIVLSADSDQARPDTVFKTLPDAGATLFKNDTVTLYVGRRSEALPLFVPPLTGLSESEALAKLSSVGLTAGDISYQSSSQPLGTVIAQRPSANTPIALGGTVSLVISAGDRYHVRTVPDLYGLSLSEATNRLREFGLVVGTLHPISSAAPSGTVIEQAPRAGAPISSSLFSVDLYVSS